MTQPKPPASRTGDSRLARDVAKHLDRRRMRRKLLLWAAILALIAAAAMYLTCGRGFGLGGLGKGAGEPGGPGSAHTLVGPQRCAIRVTASGITVDGKPMPSDEAVTTCKAMAGADVVVTGDARQGDWELLKAALQAADVKDIVVHEPAPAGAGPH